MTSDIIYRELIRVFCIITAAFGGGIALGYGLRRPLWVLLEAAW